jgi:hypothetical protein
MTAGEVLLALGALLAAVAVVGAVVDRIRALPAGQPGTVARLLLGAVRFYRRFVGPALPPSCRFTPSCSAYALEALQRHGAVRGSWLTARRLLRCGPWHPGGHDPVPSAVDRSGAAERCSPTAAPTPIVSTAREPSPTPTGVHRC